MKELGVYAMQYEHVYIHDLEDDMVMRNLTVQKNKLVIPAKKIKAATCIGCFGCWLKTPGICVLPDVLQNIGAIVAQAESLTIVSQNWYGGYSAEIKKVMDRCISSNLPLFVYRNKEVHHPMRYKNRINFTAYFYGDINDIEKEIAQELVQANALNLGLKNAKVLFAEDIAQLKEVWQ